MSVTQNKFSQIKKFLLENADSIQKLATKHHKDFLGDNIFRSELLRNYQDHHIKIVKELANNLNITDVKKRAAYFKKLGETYAKESVSDGLTLEEAVDGIIFLKQAVWEMLDKKGVVDALTAREFYQVNQSIGTICDVIASKIAFAYHGYFQQNVHTIEEQFTISEKRYRTVIEQSPLSTQILAPSGKTIMVNKAWEELWGAKLEQLKDYNMLKDAQLTKLGIMSYIKKGFKGVPTLIPAVRYEPQKTLPNVTEVSYRWVRAFIYPVKDENGTIREVVLVHDDITEQKKAEEALIESEQRFRNLADTAPMYIAMADETGDAVYFNRPWLEFTGQKLDDMLGLGWLRTLHPEDAPRFEKDFKHAFQKHISISEEYRFRRADGEYRWMLAVGAPRFTPDGRFIGYFGTYTDFHELKEAQLAMKESEERFRQLAETIPHIVFSANSDSAVEYINQKWFEYTGASQDFEPTSWASYIHPDDISSLLSVWEEAKKKNESYEAEYRLKRYDGIYRWYIARSSPIKNKKGEIVRWFGTATDIEDSKQAERNLRYLSEASKVLSSSLDFNKTLINIAQLAVPEIADWCAIDILGEKGSLERVAIAHKDPKKVKWARQLGKKYPPDMNAQTGIPKVIRTGESELYPFIPDEFLVKVARDKEHLKLIRSIGFTSAMIVPLCRENKCIGGISFVTAEAKRQYTESDLRMAQELASRASMALDNAWLYKGSQDAIALRDNFISVASHELKTPVTSVKIFTQVLQQHSAQIGDEKAMKHLEKMDKQLNKLTDLIYNLLNISKIQAGRMEFNQKQFDFDSSIQEIIEVLQEGAAKHKLIIKGKTNKKVYGDEDRIGQVVSNLVANAIKYSPKSDKIIIHLNSDEKNVNVCVEDFGIGLAKEHVEKIFERFYRVFDTTDKTFPGLGIGLYISSEIIKRHHGKLWVESDGGKGSKFYFSLPLKRDSKPNGVQVL